MGLGDEAKDWGAVFEEPRGLDLDDEVKSLGVVRGIVEARAREISFTSGGLVPRDTRNLDPVDESKLWEAVPGDISGLSQGNEYNMGGGGSGSG